MGVLSATKNGLCDFFGIETQAEKDAKALEDSSFDFGPEQAPASEEEKQKKEENWTDTNEQLKYVCQGGKVQCQFCNVPISDIIVTSTTITLQDKPWTTVKDKDGLVNFNFTGLCMHPSQQKPASPPPPCKSIISLGEWKDYSNTIIDNNNALVVKSTIPCQISGQDLTVVHSGQMAKLTKVAPEVKKAPKVSKIYFVNGKWMRTENGEYQVKSTMNNSEVIFCIELKNVDNIPKKSVEVHLHDANDYDIEKTVLNADTNTAQKDWNITDNKAVLKLKLVDYKQLSNLYVICKVKDGDGKTETVRFPQSENDCLTVYPSICIDKYKMPGLNKTGTDIADDMTFGTGIGCKSDVIYSKVDVYKYKKEYKEIGFNIEKHERYANIPSAPLFELPIPKPKSPSKEQWNDPTYHRQDKTVVVKPLPLLSKEMKMKYLKEEIESASYSFLGKRISTGKMVENYRKMAELTGNAERVLLKRFRLLVNIFFDYGELSGNIGKMIDKFGRSEGGIYESQQLSDNLANNPSTERFCKNINKYIKRILKESKGDIAAIIDNHVYFDDREEGEDAKDTKARKVADKEFGQVAFSWTFTTEGMKEISKGIEEVSKEVVDDALTKEQSVPEIAKEIAKGIKEGIRKAVNNEEIPEKVKEDVKRALEGVKNVLGGRTIATNDVWAREVHLQSFCWTGEYEYKGTYEITFWDHFGLDKPDLEKFFNIVPLIWEVFACWFLLQHCYAKRPFITKISFVKEFSGSIKPSESEQKIEMEQTGSK